MIKKEKDLRETNEEKIELKDQNLANENIGGYEGREEKVKYSKIEADEYQLLKQGHRDKNIQCVYVDGLGYLYFKEFEVGQMHSYFTICADSGVTMSNDDKGRIIEELILESLVYPFQATSVSEIRNYLFKESPQMALVLLMFLTQKNRDIRKCSQVSYAMS